MAKPVLPPEKARQGRWGSQVLIVLVVALILAMIAWFGAEMFGQSTETPATQNNSGGNATATQDGGTAGQGGAPAPAND